MLATTSRSTSASPSSEAVYRRERSSSGPASPEDVLAALPRTRADDRLARRAVAFQLIRRGPSSGTYSRSSENSALAPGALIGRPHRPAVALHQELVPAKLLEAGYRTACSLPFSWRRRCISQRSGAGQNALKASRRARTHEARACSRRRLGRIPARQWHRHETATPEALPGLASLWRRQPKSGGPRHAVEPPSSGLVGGDHVDKRSTRPARA